jgi:hypothetical protein
VATQSSVKLIGLPFSGKGVTHLDGAEGQVVPTQDRLAELSVASPPSLLLSCGWLGLLW